MSPNFSKKLEKLIPSNVNPIMKLTEESSSLIIWKYSEKFLFPLCL